ncbi:serine-rich repeat [Schistosoma japonicum]|nr:serine-rich repeat [Schistosoma japonicum]
MSTGGYHHAIILSPGVYARQCYTDNISNDSSYWKHEDAARHLSNHVMNKYPNLNVLCLNNSNYMKNDLWSDPTCINACLFSQASRVVLFIPDDATEHITHFSRHCLQPLLCRSRDQGGRPEWHSRFIGVAIGSVQVPNQLNSDVPFINVIRFREIGWFRDIMGMMLLERAIKDFWIPPEMKEFTSQHSNLKQSNMMSMKYSLNEIVETTSVVDITTRVIGKMDLDEMYIKHSCQRSESPSINKLANSTVHNKDKLNELHNNHSSHSPRPEEHASRLIRRHIKPEFEAEQIQENILEARLIGTIGQVVPVSIKKELMNYDPSIDISGHNEEVIKISTEIKAPTESLEKDIKGPSLSLDVDNKSISTPKTINTIQVNGNSIVASKADHSDNLLTSEYPKSSISSIIPSGSVHQTVVESDVNSYPIQTTQTIDHQLKQGLDYKDIPMIDEDVEYVTKENAMAPVSVAALKESVPITTTENATLPATLSMPPLVTSSISGRSNNEVRTKIHKITREETFTSHTETITTTTSSINRIVSTPTTTVDSNVKRQSRRDHVTFSNLTGQKENKGESISPQPPTDAVQSEENDKHRNRSDSSSPIKKPIRIISVSRTKSVEPNIKEPTDKNKSNEYIRTINIPSIPKEVNRSDNNKSRSNSIRKYLRSNVGSPSRSSRSPTKSSSPCSKKIVKVYATRPFSKLQNMLSDASTQMVSPLATGAFTNEGVTCYALSGLQYRQKVDTTNTTATTITNTSNSNNSSMGNITNNHTTNLHSKIYPPLSVSREMNNWTGPDSAETYRLELLLAGKVLIQKHEKPVISENVSPKHSIVLVHSDNQIEDLSHHLSTLIAANPSLCDINNGDGVNYMTFQLLGVFVFTFITLMISLTVAFICLHHEGCDFISFIKYTIKFFQH